MKSVSKTLNVKITDNGISNSNLTNISQSNLSDQLMNCPVCGGMVAKSAKACPHCGYNVADATNDIIRVAVDRGIDYTSMGVSVKIVGPDGTELGRTTAGGIIEIHSNKDIPGCRVKTDISLDYCVVTLSPKNGGRYRASWGSGLLGAVIKSCNPVDSINGF